MSRRRRLVVGFGVAAVALGTVILLVLAGLGAWWNPDLSVATHPAPAAAPTSTSPPVDPTPMHAAVVALLDAAGDPGLGVAAGPVLPMTRRAVAKACDASVPMVAASRSLNGDFGQATFSVEAYAAGFGQRILQDQDQAAVNCGARVNDYGALGADNFAAQQRSVSDLRWREGDVILTLTNFDGAGPGALVALARAIDSRATHILSPVCARLDAPADDARRNPRSGDYTPLLVPQAVAVPDGVNAPDLSLLRGPLPSVPPPTPGSVTVPPSPPVPPVPMPVPVIEVLTADTAGPGCGWAFSGETPPAFDASAAAHETQVQTTLAQSRLRDAWSQWPTAVNSYLAAEALYQVRVAAYQQWVATTTTTTTTTPRSTTTTTAPTTTTIAPTTTRPAATTAPTTTSHAPPTTRP